MPCNTSFSRTMARPGLLLPSGLMLAVFACMFYLIGRTALPVEGRPVFYVAKESGWLELGRGFDRPGFRQFIDVSTPGSVVKMTTGLEVPFELPVTSEWTRPLESGERLDLRWNGPEIAGLKRFWMSASARMTLSIPLHPDRMSYTDWLDLPGIGPKLAGRIEAYRQKNGDFGSLDALQQVPGIGPGRIAAWEVFF